MDHAHRINQKHSKKLVIAGIVAALVLGGGGTALAYWTSQGTGIGTATTGETVDFEVASEAPVGAALIPGGPEQTVAFTVTNPSAGVQTLSSVVVTVANSDGSTWVAIPGCSAADYTVGTPDVVYGEIAADDAVTGSVSITMNNLGTDQNACQSVTVPLYFVAA